MVSALRDGEMGEEARTRIAQLPFSTIFGAPGTVTMQPPHLQRWTTCTCSWQTKRAATIPRPRAPCWGLGLRFQRACEVNDLSSFEFRATTTRDATSDF